MTLTAREALERAIAAAEHVERRTDELEMAVGHAPIGVYAQLAQAWAAIAREVASQEWWDHERDLDKRDDAKDLISELRGAQRSTCTACQTSPPSLTRVGGNHLYCFACGVYAEYEGGDRLDGVPLAMQVTDEGGDGGDQ